MPPEEIAELLVDDDPDVSPEESDEPAAPPAEKGEGEKGKPEQKDEVDKFAALESRFATLADQNAKLIELLTKREQPQPKDDEDEDDDPVAADADPSKLLDELNDKGVDALVRRGVLTKKDARALIEKTVQKALSRHAQATNAQAAESARIIQDYPDIANPQTALSRRANEIYAEECGRDPRLKGNISAFRLAVRAAKNELDTAETSRRGRVAAQDPPSRTSRRSDDEPGSKSLSNQQRAVLERMGVTEDDFRQQVAALEREPKRRSR